MLKIAGRSICGVIITTAACIALPATPANAAHAVGNVSAKPLDAGVAKGPAMTAKRARKVASILVRDSMRAFRPAGADPNYVSVSTVDFTVDRCARVDRLTFDCPATVAAFDPAGAQTYGATWTIRVWRLVSWNGFNDYANVPQSTRTV